MRVGGGSRFYGKFAVSEEVKGECVCGLMVIKKDVKRMGWPYGCLGRRYFWW